MMNNEHIDTAPAWVEGAAKAAPVILGTSAGLLLGNLMNPGARRGLGFSLGIIGVSALIPFVVDEVASLLTGPRSKVGVKRKIQRIRDNGAGIPEYDDVDEQLRENGLI